MDRQGELSVIRAAYAKQILAPRGSWTMCVSRQR
jgi:hypothetical protein